MIISIGRMGIGPLDIYLDDTIVIILSGGVLYIIRNQGSVWVFIGESYIEGLISSEAIQVYQ
jgi:hypothetical protein